MTTSIPLRCVAGPDAGWVVNLEPGSHWLGRAACGVRVFDRMLEAHHARVDVRGDGAVSLLQTSGRTPVVIDGEPAAGWMHAGAGATIEVGGSRIEVGRTIDAGTPPVAWVFEPQNVRDDERERFARDVRLAAATSWHSCLDACDGSIELGVAEVDLPIDIRDANGRTVPLGELDHAAQSIVERACRRVLPIRTQLSADHPIAVVAADPSSIADALTAQLDARRRARVIVADSREADEFADVGRPMIVLVHDEADVPPWCRAILDVGTTWRATWSADVLDRPGDVVRIHARGRSRERAAMIASTDAVGALVAQQVARTGAEAGCDVAGVPESARRQ